LSIPPFSGRILTPPFFASPSTTWSFACLRSGCGELPALLPAFLSAEECHRPPERTPQTFSIRYRPFSGTWHQNVPISVVPRTSHAFPLHGSSSQFLSLFFNSSPRTFCNALPSVRPVKNSDIFSFSPPFFAVQYGQSPCFSPQALLVLLCRQPGKSFFFSFVTDAVAPSSLLPPLTENKQKKPAGICVRISLLSLLPWPPLFFPSPPGA